MGSITRSSQEEMPDVAHNSSAHSGLLTHRGLLTFRAIALALMFALLLAGRASADAVTSVEPTVPETVEAAPETVEEAAESAPPALSSEESAEVAPTPLPPEEVAPTPGPEEVVEPPSSLAEGPAPEASEGEQAILSSGQEAPPVSSIPPATADSAPEEAAAPAQDGTGAGAGAEAFPSQGPPLIGALLPPPGARAEEPVSADGSPADSDSQLAGALSCALSGLGAGMIDSCSGGAGGAGLWLPRAPFGPAAAVSLDGGPATSGAHVSHGAPARSAPPVNPAPGSAPAGSSGAAMGSSGFGLSLFLGLSCLLLLAAPRALRLLTVLAAQWRTACFVLIPERPD
jgi:hypothetical protein